MSAIRQVSGGQRRVLAALALTTVTVAAAHAALERALTGEWDLAVVAVDAGTAVIVLGVAALYLHSLARERRREVVEHMLLGILATPTGIRDTAQQALRALEAYGIGDAAVLAVVSEGDAPLRPIAARGYPRGWTDVAPPGDSAKLPEEPSLERPRATHPWTESAVVPLGKRPWIAKLPLRSGGESIGLVMIAARRPGVLRDPGVRELLASHLSAALDHAALYEAAYARERSLEDLEARRREFMAAIAHEIRTPLTSIQAFADLLQMGQAEMDDTARDLVASLGQGVQRLSSLINDLIDLGRSGDVAYATRSIPVDLSEVVRAAEATLRPALMLRHQSVTLDLPADGPVVISDPRIVEQVTLNLLSNANRHTPPGGKITVTARQLDHSTVRLEVTDSGPGIPADERDRIFEPYYRVRGGDGVPGSGLGLAVARRLLEESGGRIWAAEPDGGGARFCVELRAAH